MLLSCLYEPTTLLLGLTVFIVVFYLMKCRRRENYPPGPTGVPMLGYLPFLSGNLGEKFVELKKKYGSVFSVKMGPDDWVVLNDYDVMNEAFVKKGETFSGRPTNEFIDLFTGNKGVAMADYGETWKNLRKFGLTTLRGFGVGKKGMEDSIIEETPFLVESLTTGSERNVKEKLSYAVSNIICRVAFGSRFDYDDEDFINLQKSLSNMQQDSYEMKLIGLVTVAPVLKHLPVFNKAMDYAKEEIATFLGILDKIKEQHKASYDENDVRDFIDAFIHEMKQGYDEESGFTDPHLLQYIRDLFEAGTATTSSTLAWIVLAFLQYPECQEKIYEEIEATFGDSGVPSMKYREKMPYTCAFIQEIVRHRVLLPIGVFHKATSDGSIAGYTVPKNTTIIGNIWAVHYDPNLFKNPEEFRPERFLDEDGKFIQSKHVIPFSIGPRHCLGEQLARMELFIFLTGIVQKLKILPDEKHPPPDFHSGNFNMLFYDSKDFKVCFEKR